MTALTTFKRRLSEALGLPSITALDEHLASIRPELEAWVQQIEAQATAERKAHQNPEQ